MPKLSELRDSKYLTKEDCGKGILLTITGCVHQNVALESQPQKMKWCLTFEETEKMMALNSTNAQLIQEFLGGENTDDWIGHQIVLYNDPTIMFQGKRTGGIRARAPRAPQPAAARPAATAPQRPPAPRHAPRPAPAPEPEPEPQYDPAQVGYDALPPEDDDVPF